MIPLQVESSDVDRELRRRGRDLEREGRKAAKTTKGAGGPKRGVAGAAILGGVAGAVIGGVTGNDAFSAILELLLSIMAAVFAPLLLAMLPLVQALTPIMVGFAETLLPLITRLVDAVTSFIGKTNERVRGLVEDIKNTTPDDVRAGNRQVIESGEAPRTTRGLDPFNVVGRFFDVNVPNPRGNFVDALFPDDVARVIKGGQKVGVVPDTPLWLEGFFQ